MTYMWVEVISCGRRNRKMVEMFVSHDESNPVYKVVTYEEVTESENVKYIGSHKNIAIGIYNDESSRVIESILKILNG